MVHLTACMLTTTFNHVSIVYFNISCDDNYQYSDTFPTL